jgi:hypothetical protein
MSIKVKHTEGRTKINPSDVNAFHFWGRSDKSALRKTGSDLVFKSLDKKKVSVASGRKNKYVTAYYEKVWTIFLTFAARNIS